MEYRNRIVFAASIAIVLLTLCALPTLVAQQATPPQGAAPGPGRGGRGGQGAVQARRDRGAALSQHQGDDRPALRRAPARDAINRRLPRCRLRSLPRHRARWRLQSGRQGDQGHGPDDDEDGRRYQHPRFRGAYRRRLRDLSSRLGETATDDPGRCRDDGRSGRNGSKTPPATTAAGPRRTGR